MKKTVSLLIAVLMLLSFSACVFAEGEDLIPGTEFPMPDAVTGVKSSSVVEMNEKFMLEMMGVDMMINIYYADASSASQALGEYRSRMEVLFPGMTDSKGNVLLLPDSATSSNFPIKLNLNKEPISYIGMECIGWFDISSCNDVLNDPHYSEIERRMGVSSEDGLVNIQCELFESGYRDQDFADVCAYLLRKYTHDNRGNEIPESENAFKNIVSAELELDGAPAYKISYEAEEPWGRCEMLSRVVYLTTNAAGDYIRLNLTTPKEGNLDKDGNPYRPAITDLVNIIENTYTRTEP